MIKILAMPFLFLVILGCSKVVVLPKQGQDYDVARQTLISDNWHTVMAICNIKNGKVCFHKYPELATNSDGGNCGQFERGASAIEVCTTVEGTDDGIMLVRSSRTVR